MTEGKTVADRIKDTLAEKKIKKGDFYKSIGLTPQSIRNWGIRESLPAVDTAIKMADYLGVSVRWLITGIEESGLTQEDQALLDAFHRLNDDGKENAILLIKALETKYPLPLEQAGGSSKTAT
jgi:DNA-binding XRE family transcriptional regulator